MQLYGLKQLLLYHCMREMRTVMEGYNGLPWVAYVHHDQYVGMVWGRDSVQAAQSLLHTFLTISDGNITLLSASPDNIFIIITFAGILLIVYSFSLYQYKGHHLGGAIERVISLSIEKLGLISTGIDSLPAKSAHLLAGMLALWERRMPSTVPVPAPPIEEQYFSEFLTPQEDEPSEPGSAVGNGDAGGGDSFGGMMNVMTEDIFNDPDFWVTFMNNLSKSSTYYAPS